MEKMVRYLVDEANVPVNKLGGRLGYPIIRAACLDGLLSTKMLEFLGRRGALLNVADSQGRCAMHIACSSAWDDGLKALVNAGAEISVRDKSGRMPIHFAAAAPLEDCLSYLLSNPRLKEAIDINAVDHDGWTPLMWAARSGDYDSIKMLVNNGANPWVRSTAQDKAGEWSALKLLKFADRDTSLLSRPGVTDTETADWDDPFHVSRVGDDKSSRCESCFTVRIDLPRPTNNKYQGQLTTMMHTDNRGHEMEMHRVCAHRHKRFLALLQVPWPSTRHP
jgi:hypothetical protein